MEQQKLIDYKKKGFIIKLAWPIFIELLLNILAGNIDQIMVSHYSKNGVGAIGNANQIMTLLSLTFAVLSMATVILVAQYIGSKDISKISQIYSLSIITNLIAGVVIGIIILLFHNAILQFIRTPKILLKDAGTFLCITGGFIFIQSVFMTFSAIFKSNSMMRQSMIVSIVINLMIIVGNTFFIYGVGPFPAMGVMGAAISTTLSRAIGLAILIYLYHKHIGISISIKYLRPFPFDLLKKLLSIGLPSSGENLSWNGMQLMNLSFANRLGATVSTAKAYSSMLANFSFIYAAAMGQATQVMVGYMIGAMEYDDAYKHVKKTAISAALFSIVISSSLYFLSSPIFHLFTNDEAIIRLCKSVMLVDILVEIGKSSNIVLVRSLQSSGDIRYPIIVGIITMWVCGVGGAYLFGIVLKMGLPGIFLGMASDEVFRAIILSFRWKSGKWRNRRLVD